MKIDDELIETPDGAFLSAMTPNKLEELELQTFGIMRQAVAISLGVTNRPEDGFFDAVVMAWLSILDEDAVLKAKRDKDQALKEAFAWADSRGYTMTYFQPLLEIYRKIMTEIDRSTNATTAGNRDLEKNFGGQPAI